MWDSQLTDLFWINMMNSNVLLGRYKQICARLLYILGVVTKKQQHIENSQALHSRGRIQQGHGMARLAAKKQLASWERKSG